MKRVTQSEGALLRRVAQSDAPLQISRLTAREREAASGMLRSGMLAVGQSRLHLTVKGWSILTGIPMHRLRETLRRNPMGGVPGGSVSACIDRMELRPGVREPGALCAWLADRAEPGWRRKKRRIKRNNLSALMRKLR